MSLHKKVLAILIVALILVIIFLGGVFVIFNRTAHAPTSNFQGPDSIPNMKGPNIPPPTEY
jgi:hypothetical protein